MLSQFTSGGQMAEAQDKVTYFASVKQDAGECPWECPSLYPMGESHMYMKLQG